MTKKQKREKLLEALRATEHLGNPHLTENILRELEQLEAGKPTDKNKSDYTKD